VTPSTFHSTLSYHLIQCTKLTRIELHPRKCHLESPYARSMHNCRLRSSFLASVNAILSADQTHDVHLHRVRRCADDLVYVDIFVACRSASSSSLTTSRVDVLQREEPYAGLLKSDRMGWLCTNTTSRLESLGLAAGFRYTVCLYISTLSYSSVSKTQVHAAVLHSLVPCSRFGQIIQPAHL
jgi:hypothetical protein